MSSVESPMQGNNWRPRHPDGGERPTFYKLKIKRDEKILDNYFK